jgi:hypothetical protein
VVYRRSDGRVLLFDERRSVTTLVLNSFGFDLFTFVPVNQGVAVFGLLDKYLGPAAVVSQKVEQNRVTVRLREAGDFGAWLDKAPARVEIDGQPLAPADYSYSEGLLRVPKETFGRRAGGGGAAAEREVRIVLARSSGR